MAAFVLAMFWVTTATAQTAPSIGSTERRTVTAIAATRIVVVLNLAEEVKEKLARSRAQGTK